MRPTQKVRPFAIRANRGFVQAAGIERPSRGSANNGVRCQTAGIQRYALPCLNNSGIIFSKIAGF